MMDDTTVDTTQQVTSKVPTTIVKNPKRVAAGKAIAEKRRQAQEAQKQKMAEADIIIANERLKKAQEEVKKADESPPSATPAATPETDSQTLSTTQWLSVIAIDVSMVGVYYNRQALKNSFYKIKAPVTAKPAPESANAPLPVNKTTKKKRGASKRWLNFLFYLNIFFQVSYTMISHVVKAAAVAAGITIAWAYFKSPSPKNQTQICEYCSENFSYYEGSHRWLICESIYVCKRCALIESMSEASAMA